MGLFTDILARKVEERSVGIEEQARAEAKAELQETVARLLGDLNEAQARYQEAKAELDALEPVEEAPVLEELTTEEVVG